MTRVGDRVDGKYEILSLIGEGGMSRVWLARDQRLNKLWAIKEIDRVARDANNAVVVQSLIAEANLMKRLDHPALPRIVDIVEDEKTVYVVMDYVEGKSLKRVMRDLGRPMDEKDVISWGTQLCDVLEYLHTRTPPVIYRDMKPSNVMLRDDGSVKLVDFGIAREYKEDRSSDTQILGTRGYAAPEQLSRVRQSDVRTDVYALGVTLWSLVTGLAPSAVDVLRPIRQVDPGLSEGLEHIIDRATRQDPAERYQSCAEMRYDLMRHDRLTEGYRSAQRAKVRRFNVARGRAGSVHHALGQGVARPVDAGRVDKYYLIVVPRQHSHNGVARRLGLGRNYGHLFADEHVDESGFSRVGAAYYGDVSAVHCFLLKNSLWRRKRAPLRGRKIQSLVRRSFASAASSAERMARLSTSSTWS